MARGIPASSAITVATSSPSARTSEARRHSALRRSSGRHDHHTFCAATALATARSTSSGPAMTTSACTFPVAGFTWAKRSLLVRVTRSSPINR